MRGGTIGIIEESKNEKFKKGEIVNCMGGWQQYCVSDGKGVRQIPQGTGFPLDCYMSILGMTGLTAYFGLLDITDPQPGETLVVSAASGDAVVIATRASKIGFFVGETTQLSPKYVATRSASASAANFIL